MSNSVKPRISSALHKQTSYDRLHVHVCLSAVTKVLQCEKSFGSLADVKICHVLLSTQTGNFAYLPFPRLPTSRGPRGRLHPVFIRELLSPGFPEKDEHTMFFRYPLNMYLFHWGGKGGGCFTSIIKVYIKTCDWNGLYF